MGTSWQRSARGAAALAFALVTALGAPRARAELGPPPPPPCASNADCSGCAICTNGQCLPIQAQGCRCDGECAVYGSVACKLARADRPLCGGDCVDAAPTEPLVCGQGADAPVVGPTSSPFDSAPSSAVLSTAVLEPEHQTPFPKPASTDDPSCSFGIAHPSRGAAWELLLVLGLLRRRR